MSIKIFSGLGGRIAPFAAAGVMALALVTPAQAQFRGGGALHAFANCEWRTGPDAVRVIYRASERDTSAASNISVYWSDGGSFNLTGWRDLDPTGTWFRVTGNTTWGGVFRWTPRPRMKVLERTVIEPVGASIETAEVVSMRVRIQHFNFEANCTADLDAVLIWADD